MALVLCGGLLYVVEELLCAKEVESRDAGARAGAGASQYAATGTAAVCRDEPARCGARDAVRRSQTADGRVVQVTAPSGQLPGSHDTGLMLHVICGKGIHRHKHRARSLRALTPPR